MIDYNSYEYKSIKNIINNLRTQRKLSWDKIKYFETSSEIELNEKINLLFPQIGLEGISSSFWLEVVEHLKLNEELGEPTVLIVPSVIIPQSNSFEFEIDESKGSAWISYKRRLKSLKFDEATIDMIEESSYKILNKLSIDTRNSGPVKGLVIGNVQSGKTANMAALMAMAADNGWNLFIVLSGTIENLRIQTQSRLINDLNGSTNVTWNPIDNVQTNSSYVNALANLQISENSPQRYLMVCLKNSSRLINLLKWLQKDLKAREKLKILFIDDEADQAGINSIRVCKNYKPNDEIKERTKINQLIVNLLTNKDSNGKEIETKFKSLNYIGYTATPYANVLNEKPGPESIYPESFVSCLSVTNSYFGPQVIFGLQGTDNDGLNIVHIIDPSELEIIKDIGKGNSIAIPSGLEHAILWFVCCFAIKKHYKIFKPVSMLIHTSQKQIEHDYIANAIKKWFSKFVDQKQFLKKCEKVFFEETSFFTLSDFNQSFSNYGLDVRDYPKFMEIANEILEIFNCNLNTIKIDENGEPKFNKGINICIDNCGHSYIENNNEHIRLIYPNAKSNVNFTTGFIVIGGATLSRGLTIEGLVCSYFLRTVKQADTLMQMGRWFGYRKGYELLPRIWLTENTNEQFKFLSLLDFELREEMKYMEENGIKPSLVGIKVKNHPLKSFIEITSKNKKKDAELVDVNYGGLITQTTIFYEDEKIIKDNLDCTNEFIKKLGNPLSSEENKKHPKADNALIWENINNDLVLDYLSNMKFPKNDNTFLNIKLLKKWYNNLLDKKMLEDWNVVVAGSSRNDEKVKVRLGDFDVSKVNRSRKINHIDDGLIRIGALRAMKDVYVDINLDSQGLTEKDKDYIFESNSNKYKIVRNHSGLGKKSLLIIYIIDKNSKPREGIRTRESLKTLNDIIGITIVTPQDESLNNNGEYVSIKIDSDYYDKMREVDVDYED